MVSGISSRFQLLFQSPGQVSHVLRTRSPLGRPEQAPWTSFDLHVLSTPPAFILSQDQTLQQKPVRANSDRLRQRVPAVHEGNTPVATSVLAVVAEPPNFLVCHRLGSRQLN